jgi:uncharacterized BrkB/YihY/UPF0761 family membrane protein
MLVLKLLGFLVAVLAIVVALFSIADAFNAHCVRKFGHRFLTVEYFGMWAILLALCWAGSAWYGYSAANHGDVLSGLVLAGAGLAGGLAILVTNIMQTNVIYGLFGTAVQMAFAVMTGPFILGAIGGGMAEGSPSGTRNYLP